MAVKQILEDETMMNRETQVLKEIREPAKAATAVINLREHFYSDRQATLAEGQEGEQAPQGKMFLNLITDFMEVSLSKFNESSRLAYGSAVHPERVALIRHLML